MKVRASQVDLVLACPSAALEPKTIIDERREDAALGTAVHAALAAWVDAGRPEQIECATHAARHGVKLADVEALAAYAPAALDAIKEAFGDLETETPLHAESGFRLTGTADVVSVVQSPTGPFSISVVDWKTGRDSSFSKVGQMTAYAFLAWMRHGEPSSGYVYVGEAWLRDRSIIERRLTVEALRQFGDDLAAAVGRAGKTYSPGTHCQFCPHWHDCAPRDEYLRSTAAILVDMPKSEITPAKMAGLWEKSRALSSALARYERAIKLALLDGPIDRGDGTSLAIEQTQTEKLDARAAWPHLKNHGLTDSDIAGALSLSKTKVNAALSAKHGRGQKKAAIGALYDDLRDAGAIETTHRQSVKVVSND